MLIVYAHPEPRSFNAALRDVAVQTLREGAHEVEVSDLYAMKFKPAIDQADFGNPRNSEYFNVSLEQRHATKEGGLARQIESELAKLQAADLLVLQFPLWWFGMPAILKGWIDRVFLSGVVYGRSALFESGRFQGKRALVSVTAGAPAAAFGSHALYGDILDILMPLHRGVLGFTGMSVLPPFFCAEVPYVGSTVRENMLAAYRDRLTRIVEDPPLQMPRVADHPQLGEALRAQAK